MAGWLPRLRGDRPASSQMSAAIRDGFPACAGIDLSRTTRGRVSGRLPRLRGDRPGDLTLRAAIGQGASPPARGSTPKPAGVVQKLDRLPRLRGDRPLRNHRRPENSVRLPRLRGDRPRIPVASIEGPRRWLPRLRGDRPDPRCLWCRLPTGFPACAGIDPGVRHYACLGYRGFPACAGIDPKRRRTLCCSRPWLPRLRGDRPVVWMLVRRE